MAQTQIYSKLAQVHLVNTATDAYTAPAGDNSNIFLARDVEVTHDAQEYDPEYVRADALNPPRTPGSSFGTISFKVPIKGSGTIAVAPEYNLALQACGLSEVIAPATSVTYQRCSTFDGLGGNPHIAYSCSVLINGVRHAIAGAFGNLNIVGDSSGVGMFEFTMQGTYQAYAADALEAPVYETTVAPGFRAMSFSTNFGGAYVPIGVTNFNLNLNNILSMGADVNGTQGYYGCRIVPGGRPSGSFDPELVLPATHDFYADRFAGTVGSITTGVIGATVGNKYTITVYGAQLDMPVRNVRNGIEGLTCGFVAAEEATAAEGAAATDVLILFT